MASIDDWPDCFQQVLTAGHIFIAYSGGKDSHVLLHSCAAQVADPQKITAVYVHHGLLQEADAWAEHCAAQASLLGVNFLNVRVDALPECGESPEEAARNARYQALKNLLTPGDVLLLGQHREDQLETVLLQLFRGAGPSGLAGMPSETKLGKGKLIRPLLNVSRKHIDAYAKRHQLTWVEDPTNRQDDYARNFLRNQIIPRLKQRWPGIDKTVFRSAKHCAEASQYLADRDRDLLAEIFDPVTLTLSLSGLQRADCVTQGRLIRAWFKACGLKMPSTSMLHQIVKEVMDARPDADPKVYAKGFMVRRYREKLYLLYDAPGIDSRSCTAWPKKSPSLDLPNNGRLLLSLVSGAGLSRAAWENAQVKVRYRQGGEAISLPRRQGKHALKKLFQEAGIPPWIREITPLIYLDEHLVAVGELWLSADYYHSQGADNIRFNWLRDEMPWKHHDEIDRVD